MDEEKLAQQLKQNVPVPYQTDLAPVQDSPANNGEATIAPTYELDEITQYKLHDYFGASYKAQDETAKQRIQFIYDTVAKTLGDPQYGFVVARIRELEQIIGTTNSDDRMYKLYQWLKLEGIRKNIDAEMAAI